MKTIKIIDLLNNKANGKEVPKTIKYQNKIFQWYGWTDDIYDYVYSGCEGLLNDGTYDLFAILNQEVEIIEEEKKIPEKLTTWFSLEKDCENDNIQYANYNFERMYGKINEICDYLKSKGDE